MLFLLVAVNSKYIHTNPALYSLQRYACHYGEDLTENVKIAEYTINQRTDEILSEIYRQKPDVIGISVYIWNVTEVLNLVREIRKIMPKTPIWLGGPEVTYRPEEVLREYPEVTGIMLGEGEATFLELVTRYKDLSQKGIDLMDKSMLMDVDGLMYISADDTCVKTEDRGLTDLSTLPFLYDDLSEFDHKIIYYETSRGCPFRCSYCLSSIDKKVRLRDIEMVKKELQFFLDHKVPQVKFIDRTFNCNHDHAMAIWQYIKDHDNGVTNFHFEVGADLLREDELALLNTLRPGAVQMEIGVQTTNEKTIHEICRIMDIPTLRGIVERLHAGHNIHIHLDLIAGLPYEDYKTFQRSFDDVFYMKPEQLQLGFLKVLSGSMMKEKEKEYEILYTSKPPYEVLSTKWITYEEICRLKQVEEMVEIYYNSNQFTYTLPLLLQFFESPFTMFETMADFYDRKGYFTNTPSRTYRYDVLLQFAMELFDEHRADILDKPSIAKLHREDFTKLIAELLTMDIYLRENAKSRPTFSRDMNPYKDAINRFYREEEKHRENGTHLLKNYVEYDPRNMVRMLHIEAFDFDILGANPTYEKKERPTFVIFDYKERNALTYDAKIMEVRVADEETHTGDS